VGNGPPLPIRPAYSSRVSERERLAALWASLEPGRREELKRSLQRGEPTRDPELAWFATMTMGESTERFVKWYFVGTAIALGAVIIAILLVVVTGVATGNASGLWLPMLQIAPVLALVGWLFRRGSRARRAYRLNKLIAVPPRGWRGSPDRRPTGG
jgi:hypothetical protein